MSLTLNLSLQQHPDRITIGLPEQNQGTDAAQCVCGKFEDHIQGYREGGPDDLISVQSSQRLKSRCEAEIPSLFFFEFRYMFISPHNRFPSVCEFAVFWRRIEYAK